MVGVQSAVHQGLSQSVRNAAGRSVIHVWEVVAYVPYAVPYLLVTNVFKLESYHSNLFAWPATCIL